MGNIFCRRGERRSRTVTLDAWLNAGEKITPEGKGGSWWAFLEVLEKGTFWSEGLRVKLRKGERNPDPSSTSGDRRAGSKVEEAKGSTPAFLFLVEPWAWRRRKRVPGPPVFVKRRIGGGDFSGPRTMKKPGGMTARSGEVVRPGDANSDAPLEGTPRED